MKMSYGLAATLVAATVGFSCNAASAAIIAEYAFTGNSTAGKVATTVDPSVTASDAVGAGGWSFGDHNTVYINVTKTLSANEALAVSSGKYSEYTVTPNAGKTLDLSELAFNYGVTMQGGSNPTGTVTYFVRSNAEATPFSTTLGSFAVDVATSNNSYTLANLATIDLSGAGFQGLATPIAFRIYAYQNVTLGDTTKLSNYARVDNVALSGTVVPEPASLALLGLGGLLLIGRRKRA